MKYYFYTRNRKLELIGDARILNVLNEIKDILEEDMIIDTYIKNLKLKIVAWSKEVNKCIVEIL